MVAVIKCMMIMVARLRGFGGFSELGVVVFPRIDKDRSMIGSVHDTFFNKAAY